MAEVNDSKRAPTFPLLRLPPELRNRVYGFVLDHAAIDIGPTGSAPFWKEHPHGLALLCTNRQIHAEAALLPYRHITFCFSELMAIVHFLEKLSNAQRSIIRELGLMTYLGVCMQGDHVYRGFSKESFRYMEDLPNLSKVLVREHHDFHDDVAMKSNMMRTAELIRKWKPAVKIMVEDGLGEWREY